MEKRGMGIRLLTFGVVAVTFGCLDAHLYLGHGAGFWVSNVSSAWLLLPFLGGACAVRTRKGGVLLGLVVTNLAFVAFYGWTALQSANQFTSHDWLFLLGGAVSGPIFGLLGRLWAEHRFWALGLPLVIACIGEPYAWYRHVGRLPNPHAIWAVEVAVGIVMAVIFIVASRATRTPPVAT